MTSFLWGIDYLHCLTGYHHRKSKVFLKKVSYIFMAIKETRIEIS